MSAIDPNDEPVARMITELDSDWVVKDVVPEDTGVTHVFHLTIDTGNNLRECILKATPDEAVHPPHDIATEARLLTILDEHTSIPVPAVIGSVEDESAPQAPYFLMEAIDGRTRPFVETGDIPHDVFQRIAFQTGEHLGQLHAIDAIDSFGRLGTVSRGELSGERPPADLGQLTVENQYNSWMESLEQTIEHQLNKLSETGFADLVPHLRSWFRERLERFSGNFSPTIGRLDHGVNNILFNSDNGDVQGVIDWGFTSTVTPGYDFATVVWMLSGALLSPLPGEVDRRQIVREAMVEGYRQSESDVQVVLQEDLDLYELESIINSMIHLESSGNKIPDGYEEAAVDGIRAKATTIVGVD